MYSRCTGNVGAPGKSHRANHWNGANSNRRTEGYEAFCFIYRPKNSLFGEDAVGGSADSADENVQMTSLFVVASSPAGNVDGERRDYCLPRSRLILTTHNQRDLDDYFIGSAPTMAQMSIAIKDKFHNFWIPGTPLWNR
jgi:hypothetical protein